MTPNSITVDLAYLALYLLQDLFVLAAAGLVVLAVGDMLISMVQLIRR
jgi:hypothetical protein